MSVIASIYTDGSCNNLQGGWSAILLTQDDQISHKLYGSQLNTTCCQMELIGCIKAINYIRQYNLTCQYTLSIYSDSTYLTKGFYSLARWKDNNWRTNNNQPIKNLNLWQQIHNFSFIYDLKFVWVKGHANNKYNELADRLAKKGAHILRGEINFAA